VNDRERLLLGGEGVEAVLTEDDFPNRAAAKSGASNNLGFEIPFALSDTTPQAVIQLPTWGMPTGWTLSFGYRLNDDLVLNQAFDAVLEVDFGAGGVFQTFECDLVVGTRVSLPMNSVVARARFEDIDVLPPAGEVQLNALLARGFARSHATRTVSLTVAAPAASVSAIIPIPPFARSFQLVTGAQLSDVYGASFAVLLLLNTGGQIRERVNGDFFLTGPGTKMPIPSFAKYVQVLNNTGNVQAVHIIFNLFSDF
jgi:hypothetical protein